MDIGLKIATVFEFGVLALLFALSIWSIAIMIDRKRALSHEKSESTLEKLRAMIARRDRAAIQKWCEANPGLHAGALKAALETSEFDPEKVDRAVRSFLTRERLRFERGLPVLATLGANTPFIGLFGTVLGIIRAFAALGESAGGASSVMSGISQALVATAAGLFVAIPAVVAFNVFSNRLRALIAQCDSLKDLFIASMAPGGR
jgi:biopolymer transport protein ExbB